jgi:predicted 3-demethylubiquinone-9 3-methyltransferase (glyoxalase superfamily)
VSWQVVPTELPDLIKHPKAMQAMLQMKKFDLATLRKAAA